MPRAPQVCAEPGCPKLRPCPTHQPRPNSRQRGYDHKWARTRGRYLQLHPVCEQPTCTEPATDVHHLDGLGPLGPQGHTHTNLQALCHSHHSTITARTTNSRRAGT